MAQVQDGLVAADALPVVVLALGSEDHGRLEAFFPETSAPPHVVADALATAWALYCQAKGIDINEEREKK